MGRAEVAVSATVLSGAGAAAYYVWTSGAFRKKPDPPLLRPNPDEMTEEEVTEEIECTLEELQAELKAIDHFGAYAGECIPPRCDPMVLLVGNHSSGKSTFINNLCGGMTDQEVGTAPTDDGFTVIQNGPFKLNENGYTAVSRCEDSSRGFEELKTFGNSFVQHFKRKVRDLGPTAALPQGVVVVDTPGTIDTPTPEIGREYNFTRVVKWFVRRAAVVLLFFDPANPGTTGETLEVLNEALVDSTHKFLIVLNKVDTLDNVLDFARAYGTLCWNLSKVLQKKDIPRIYTMFNATDKTNNEGSKLPIDEFERAREQVLNEIKLAPERHHDNAVATLEEAVKKLLMLHRVCGILPYRIPIELRYVTAALSAGILAYSLAVKRSLAVQVTSALSFLISAVSTCFTPSTQPKLLDRLFELRYRASLRNKEDVDVRERWDDVRNLMTEIAFSEDLYTKYRSQASQVEARMGEILETRLPRLRALIENRRRTLRALDADSRK
eukprot:TRINITY_DN1364_c0_g3_i1.p1 TRINITY_DN1364_c0_g3~~TRINITY_DN1364_c0_g3_i1.p1  ORF type:complete len:526 (+),score=215.12 TRINITY_DN1364_c0_g3_i1:92-1579(+)